LSISSIVIVVVDLRPRPFLDWDGPGQPSLWQAASIPNRCRGRKWAKDGDDNEYDHEDEND